MTKYWTVLVAVAMLAIFAPPPVARADIFEWEYINPASPSVGRQQSSDLVPDGAGANAVAAANLSNLNLTKAFLAGASLFNANLSSATLAHADFSSGSIVDLLYLSGLTTDLTGANLSQANLTDANFSGVEVYGPEGEYYPFSGANLTGANLSGADTRGANFALATWDGVNTSNMILSHGHIAGLELTAGMSLIVRDYDGNAFFASIVVDHHLTMDATGTLQLEFDADPWNSTISFGPGIAVDRGGTLELMFAQDVNLASQIGRTIDLFDWTGVTPTGAFTVESPYTWNLANLYTTGEVTLMSVSALGGNFDNDGDVDGRDFLAWQRNSSVGNLADWQANYGVGSLTSASVAVPETASGAMLAFVIGLLFARRNTRELRDASTARGSSSRM